VFLTGPAPPDYIEVIFCKKKKAGVWGHVCCHGSFTI